MTNYKATQSDWQIAKETKRNKTLALITLTVIILAIVIL